MPYLSKTQWDDEKESILKRWHAGESFTSIADTYGCSRRTVQRLIRYRWGNEYKLETPAQKHNWKKYDQQLIHLKEVEKKSYHEIGAILNIPASTIQYRYTIGLKRETPSRLMNTWDDKTISQILDGLNKGLTYEDIAKVKKLPLQRVRYLLKVSTVLKKKITERNKLWKDNAQDIRHWTTTGWSNEEIQAKLNCTIGDVIFMKRKAFVKKAKRWSASEDKALTTLIECSHFSAYQVTEYWERHHKHAGWPRRTLASIQFRAHKLGLEFSMVNRGDHTTRSDLSNILGVSEDRLRYWLAHKYLSLGSTSPTDTPMRYYIDLREVAKFALKYPFEIAPYIKSSEAFAWLLGIINDYTSLKRPCQLMNPMEQVLYPRNIEADVEIKESA